jgi:hypothetical protein
VLHVFGSRFRFGLEDLRRGGLGSCGRLDETKGAIVNIDRRAGLRALGEGCGLRPDGIRKGTAVLGVAAELQGLSPILDIRDISEHGANLDTAPTEPSGTRSVRVFSGSKVVLSADNSRVYVGLHR